MFPFSVWAHPKSSFNAPLPVETSDVLSEPLIVARFSASWLPYVLGALDQLLLQSTWQSDDPAVIAAIQGKVFDLKDLFGNWEGYGEIAPYWDEQSGSDLDGGQENSNGAPFYFHIYEPSETFQENIEDWFIAAYVGAIAGADNAVLFLTYARQFRLKFKADPYGGILDIFINGEQYASVDTYAPDPTIISQDVIVAPITEFSAFDVPTQAELIIRNSGDANEDATPTTDGYMMQVVRKQLSESEVSNPAVRWDETCDCIQQTTDNGETWIDNPGLDPRHNPAFELPLLDTTDPQCDAATNATKKLEDLINTILIGVSDGQIAMTILDVCLLFIPGINVLIALIWVVTEALLAVGTEAIAEAFDTDIYDTIKCIIYCNMGVDGTVTAEQLTAIKDDVYSQIGGVTSTVFDLIVGQIWGEIGLTNAGTVGGYTGDCDTCACDHCLQIDFEIDNGSALGFVIQGGTWTDGVGVVGVNYGAGNRNDMFGYWAFSHNVTVTEVVMGYYKGSGSGGNNVNNMNTLYPGATGYNTTHLATNSANATSSTDVLFKTMTPNTMLSGVGMDINTGDDINTVILKSLLIRYTGEQLADDNCAP